MSSPAPSFTAARATDALWGSTPMSTFIRAHTSVPVGSLCLSFGVREGHADFGLCALIPLLSHSARCGRRRDASLERANPPLCTHKGGRQLASDPYRRPRSLAAADHQASARS